EEYDATKENKLTPLRSSKVPSSRIARLMHYGSLGAGLAWGAAGSYIRGESVGGEGKQFMSDDNVRRLVDKLSTMRGAALKLGQFMSIQDSNLLPEQIEQVMLRVQNSAHYMPQWQMEKVMRQDLGENWRDGFEEFEDVPFASASIGQVHSAILSRKSSSPLAGQKVAVKVQFPGVRESIGSDLSNLRWLVTASALLPKGLFLDNTIRVMKRELDDECNYEREREMCKRFGDLLNKPESLFSVPRVVDDLCSGRVLTTEMMKGRPLTQAARFTQEKRDAIARSILELSLKELFSFRLMQTDPNWTNFLYNERTGKIELIDFGATREYDKVFMDDWLCMLRAAISGNRKECIRWSEKVGYLTGDESEGMQNAHVDSMIALGEPFRQDAPNPYPFAGQTITERVRAQIPLMLRERLTPPPEPTYSLNRKLSGAFLLCARLKAKVDCNEMFENVTKDYILGPNSTSQTKAPSPNTAVPLQASQTRPFSTSALSYFPARRQRLGNLADRWPKHIIKAMENTYASNQDENGKFVTLANDPVSPSATNSTGLETDPSKINLAAEPVGGQNVRSEDPALSPVNALDENTPLAERPINFRGISVPRKPSPPGPEDCCMSGCARCVYDLYAEDLQDYQQDLSAARTKLMALAPPIANQDWDEDLFGPKPKSQDSDGEHHDTRSVEDKAQDEVDAIIGRLDPTMKAFLQLERSLKRKGKGSREEKIKT
ncbi:ABC1-domain-containing protein, partial [Meira miltonrushii]